MNRFSLVCGFIVAALCAPVLAVDGLSLDVVNIPLDRVWALQIPGTVEVSKIVPNAQKIIIEDIRRSLSQELPKGRQAGPVFAVTGSEIEALKQAEETIVHGKKPKQSFRVHDEISIIFFSRLFGQYVYLDAIVKTGNEIQVTYRFVPHEEAVLTEHFALIPVGRLPARKYEVKIVQIPMDVKLLELGFQPPASDVVTSIVCQSSEFEVID